MKDFVLLCAFAAMSLVGKITFADSFLPPDISDVVTTVLVNGLGNTVVTQTVIPENPNPSQIFESTGVPILVGTTGPAGVPASAGIEFLEPGDPTYISDEVWVTGSFTQFVFLSDVGVSLAPLVPGQAPAGIITLTETGLPQDVSIYFGLAPASVIVQSDLDSVPLPPSAWGGMALLGGFGLVTMIRRKLRSSTF